MRSWKDLPAEILENIFTWYNSDQRYKVKKQYIFQCQRVCRHWEPSAKRVAYPEIILNSEEATQKLIAMAREDEEQSFRDLVRSINFNLKPSPHYYVVYVPNLITLFPLVEHVAVQEATEL